MYLCLMFKHYHIGHFLNQPHNPTQFEITRFETMEEPDVDDLHRHTFYEILWIEKGSTKQFIDYQAYEIQDNTLFFISQGQLHCFEEWHELEGVCLMFTEDFFLLNQQNKNLLFELSFLDNLYTFPYLKLLPAHIAELKPTLELLLAEKARSDASEAILQALLHVFLIKIQRCINAQTPLAYPATYLRTFKRFKELLDQHFAENLSASAYSDKLAITTHHLNLIVKQITGKTATEVIRARSILEAKRLLTFSALSVGEIGFRLGFEEKSYFSRIFKQDTGQTPIDFKNQMSEKYHTK